jgi:hypothetical protein
MPGPANRMPSIFRRARPLVSWIIPDHPWLFVLALDPLALYRGRFNVHGM